MSNTESYLDIVHDIATLTVESGMGSLPTLDAASVHNLCTEVRARRAEFALDSLPERVLAMFHFVTDLSASLVRDDQGHMPVFLAYDVEELCVMLKTCQIGETCTGKLTPHLM